VTGDDEQEDTSSADEPMGMRTALATSARGLWQASAARFGQAHALANARRAATGLLRERVAREEVRLYLEELEAPQDGDESEATGQTARHAAAGSDT
jgi:hypothetical protein